MDSSIIGTAGEPFGGMTGLGFAAFELHKSFPPGVGLPTDNLMLSYFADL